MTMRRVQTLGSTLVFGVVLPALLVACGGDAETPEEVVPAYSGGLLNNPGDAPNNLNGAASPASAAPGSVPGNPAGSANVGNAGNEPSNGNNQPAGNSEGAPTVNGNVQPMPVDQQPSNDAPPPGEAPDNSSEQTVDDGTEEPAVDPQGNESDFGRVGAELCPDGPFGNPLAGNLQPEVFTRQVDGVFDFFNWEGVVWVDGALYWSEIGNGNAARINRKVPGQDMERGFIEDSGSNGLAVDLDGNLLAASHLPLGQLSTFELPSGARTLGSQQFNGQAFNSPNDLVLRNDGNIYFTDPDFQAGGNRPQQNNRVYRVSPAGEVTEVDGSFQQPNGVTLSPDGNTLYVAGDGPLRAYPLDASGAPGEPTTFPTNLQVPDGMTVDCAGNIYAVENSARRIQVFSPDGTNLGSITSGTFDQPLTNVAFGGDDMRTLFISGFVIGSNQGAIYSIEMPVPGMPY